jgi:uncharacterized protein YdgA (DUF945 family)
MKKIAGLVVILAILVLGGYYGMGIATERTVRHNVDVINQSNGLMANIESYKRGWFTSTAMLDWKLHIPEHMVNDGNETVPAQDFEMKMPLVIHHGPIIFTKGAVKFGLGYASTDLALPAQYADQFNNAFTSESTKPKLDLGLFVGYLNSSDLEMSIPAFKLIAKQGGEFDWKGMNSSTTVTSNADKIDGKMQVDGMQFTQNDVKGTFGALTSEYNLHKVANGLYLGDANLSAPSIIVTQKDQTLFELNDFKFDSSSDIDDNLFSSHFKASVNKIVANGQTFGPGNLEISVRNLDATVLARINEQASRAKHGTDAEKQQALFAMLPEVPKLFSRGAELEISDLSFTMPKGTISGSLSVSLPKGETNNPFEMIPKIHGKGNLKVPADMLSMALKETNKQKLLNQNEAASAANIPAAAPAVTPEIMQKAAEMTTTQLTAMTQSGLIEKQGDYYVIELTLDQGKLMVNGKLFNPAMMKF